MMPYKRAELRRAAGKKNARYHITDEEIDRMAKARANAYVKEMLHKHAELIVCLYTQIVYEAVQNVAGYGRKRLTRLHNEIERISTKTSLLHDRKNYDAIYDWYNSLGVDPHEIAVVPKDYKRYPDGTSADDELVIDLG